MAKKKTIQELQAAQERIEKELKVKSQKLKELRDLEIEEHHQRSDEESHQRRREQLLQVLEVYLPLRAAVLHHQGVTDGPEQDYVRDVAHHSVRRGGVSENALDDRKADEYGVGERADDRERAAPPLFDPKHLCDDHRYDKAGYYHRRGDQDLGYEGEELILSVERVHHRRDEVHRYRDVERELRKSSSALHAEPRFALQEYADNYQQKQRDYTV